MDTQARSVLLIDYAQQVEPTDNLPFEDLHPVLLGLFGEVGSIMSTAKKLHREGKAFAGYRQAAIEEFGDALWYLAAICRRLEIGIDTVFSEAIRAAGYKGVLVAGDTPDWQVDIPNRGKPISHLDSVLLKLGEATAALLTLKANPSNPKTVLLSFADCYLECLEAAGMSFRQVVEFNIGKTRGRFLVPTPHTLPTFDDEFEAEERIPEHFEMRIVQCKSGRTVIQWNGVFIGEPLTDNIRDEDGYRFHDVFHFAHASILHWSPTFRSLIKHKRKSNLKIDEAQDGGRAIVIEEGLTAWIFSRAKLHGFFAGHKSISFDMLKTVQQFVSGYEVEACPLKLWEDAILQGYEVFRKIRDNNGGTVIGDRTARRVSYRLS
ncbi:MAG: nucleoside triphosphate pyrophosphohydrolase family protein [Nitrospira sp.]|nr:nucleoside triphosphate pyrophosphohydrolase family protein [Nitrospira sp.]